MEEKEEAVKSVTASTTAVSAPTTFASGLAKVQQAYIDSIEKSMHNMSLDITPYQKNCVVNELAVMLRCTDKANISIKQMDQNNITEILQNIVLLQVNPSATPAECYTIIRNEKRGDLWIKTFEFGLQGDGFDKLVRKFGSGVKKVYPYWLVREGDDFTYPSFSGVEVTAPKWTPKGYGKVVRVVYPIKYEDGSIQYHISEREEVANNVKAHISQNLMKSKTISSEKEREEIKNKIENMTLDDIFKDQKALQIMSPAYRDPHSRESMITRKMRKNICKRIPCEFNNENVNLAFNEAVAEDEYDPEDNISRPNPENVVDAEVTEAASSKPIYGPVEANEETGEVFVQAESKSMNEASSNRHKPSF